MKRFQSILCASLLTLVLGSTAFAGIIQTGSAGIIQTGSAGIIQTGSAGQISAGVAGQISAGSSGNTSTGQEVGRLSLDLTDFFSLFWSAVGL